MQHLNDEAIARCADEAPGPVEAEHLARCAECRAELEAVRDQIAALGNLPELQAPESLWERLRDRASSEGLITTDVEPGAAGASSAEQSKVHWLANWRRPARRRDLRHGALSRAAASVALLLVGGIGGAWLQAEYGGTAGDLAFAPSVEATGPVGGAITSADAEADLRAAEELYLAALTRYSELSEQDEPIDPITRLAALEGIVLTAKAALRESPADPVINGYLLTAVGQREMILRQITDASSEETWF